MFRHIFLNVFQMYIMYISDLTEDLNEDKPAINLTNIKTGLVSIFVLHVND